ncbi:hypothetical protein EPICR_160026 [Candidatus Desulfarcum epimagneticum]|uniref:Pentapeptide repeat-containing protein n=1 Tax=uncultured Desulfobacteraceae bacterium TaxID=218296 RepID=A0A484HG67_9BACT|nr:hypothetical protein EPICR_160026 [uncultured Desulfobacteraceae bacterium]
MNSSLPDFCGETDDEVMDILKILFDDTSEIPDWGKKYFWCLDGFNGLHLSNKVLNGAVFTDSELNSAEFINSDLRSADFSRATLKGADFSGANLEGAFFYKTELEGAYFDNANLISTNFVEADLTDASFNKANLEDTLIDSAIIKGTNFTDADFTEATFCRNILGESEFADLKKRRGAILVLPDESEDVTAKNQENAERYVPENKLITLKDGIFSGANFKNATLDDIQKNDATILGGRNIPK